MKSVYRSAINYVFAIIIFTSILLGIISFIIGHLPWAVTLAFGTLFLGYTIPLYLHTVYIVDDAMLKIRCGWVVRKDIAISSIREIRKTEFMRIGTPNSPALSKAEAIKVLYATYDSIIISPEHRARFITQLQTINPNIKVDDKLLV